jgi:hypothetical protein
VEGEQANLQQEMSPLSIKIRNTHVIKEKLKPSVNTLLGRRQKSKSLNSLNWKTHITHHLYTIKENVAIKKLENKKSPGPDGKYSEVIKQLLPIARQHLLNFYNSTIKIKTTINRVTRRPDFAGIVPI